ncbi:uncharacterized protein [Gossypium hirsutum]|uniref:DUF4219 domain-containing protein n=1 Tax=Gossypium hirsutum TaxID=3635 RepID=A0ABM2Z5X5_GOSHI|nr:uncharacterized protein LOC121210086 [Gossypium hirsutum]
MPDSNKNQALANIKERFALEVSDDYIKKALGKRWRDNKSTLKKQYFKKDISLEEKLRNVPPRMLRYQWEDAVRFWNSKKGEDRERVGTSSRQKQKITHTAGSRSFSPAAPPVFNGEGYHIWVVNMKTYLQVFDLWEVVNSDAKSAHLRANRTVAQIRQHTDERTKRHKAMSYIQNCVSDVIFTRIMDCETPKQA